jgi:hypothetical protein
MTFFFRHGSKLLTGFILVLFAVIPGIAQEGFLSKPLQQWSKAEVTKLLSDSAWARTQEIRVRPQRQVRSVAGQVESTSTADRQAVLGGAADARDYRFTIRLHSALPIRQALVRQEQLKWNYDQKSAEERKAFDLQSRQLVLDCTICANYYVVSVGFSSDNSSGNDMIYKWFGATTLPSIKGYIYIANERGERRDLVDVIPPKAAGDDVFFIFPRRDEKDRPLLTATDKKLIFRMSDANANSVTNFTLDVRRMIVNGKVEF